MKKISLIGILVLLCYPSSYAQELEKGEYYPTPELKKIEGTGIGVSGPDSLVVQLYSQKIFFKKGGFYLDQLRGNHQFFKNGSVVESSVGSDISSITNGSLNKKESKVVLDFYIRDLTKNKRGKLILVLSSMDATTATWKLMNTEVVRVGYEFDPNFTLPKNLKLHKVK